MAKNKAFLGAFFLIFWVENMVAQTAFSDSTKLLPLSEFLSLIKQNHPVAKQAKLFTRTAEAELLGAKGGFDPKIYGDYEQKYFDAKNYFSTGEYGVKIPTWYGIEVKANYLTSEGVFLSPENKLPKEGQALVGVSFPVLQNLLIDERRANLFKARQSQGLNQAERDNLLNDLGIEAVRTYWKWAFSFQQVNIFLQSLNIANQRFIAIKSTFDLGDRMAMDTLESYTQVQDRSIQYNEATLNFQEASLKLANFIWGNSEKPTAFNYQFSPQKLEELPLSISASQKEILVQNLVSNHPLLRSYGFKFEQLDIDRRLKLEKFKPKLNFNYNFLGNGFQLNNLFSDNYKWGVTFSTSTLFRAERGDVQLAKIKMENNRLLRDQKALELTNKLQFFFNELENLQTQIQTYTNAVDNYRQLLQLENTRFNLGESTFFLINSRESKYIEAKLKLAKLQTEYQIARAEADWASGRLIF